MKKTDWMSIQAQECDPNWPEKKVKVMKPPRFFLAHAKSCDDTALEAMVTSCSALLDRLSGGKPFDLVLGRVYFEARFKAAGSWDAWAMEVAQGKDPLTFAPIFAAIMVPAGPVGAATAKIVDFALNDNPPRPVFTFDEAGRSARVVKVNRVDAKDWKGGWRLMTDRQLG